MNIRIKRNFVEEGIEFNTNDIVASSLIYRDLMQKLITRHPGDTELVSGGPRKTALRISSRKIIINERRAYEILGIEGKYFGELPPEYLNIRPTLYTYRDENSLIICQEEQNDIRVSVGDTYYLPEYQKITTLLKECSKRLQGLRFRWVWSGEEELYF